jgi:hypothetical protein
MTTSKRNDRVREFMATQGLIEVKADQVKAIADRADKTRRRLCAELVDLTRHRHELRVDLGL